MTGGVRIGSNEGGDRAARCGDEQGEERRGLEAIREHLMPSTPVPPYTHLSSTTTTASTTSRTGTHTPAHQVHPSRRPTRAQFEHPNTSQDFEATAPAHPTPAPPLVLALAPRSSSSRARTTSGRRQHDVCTGTIPSSRLPVFVLPRRLCNVNAGSAASLGLFTH